MDALLCASHLCFVIQSAKKGGFKGEKVKGGFKSERVQKTVFSILYRIFADERPPGSILQAKPFSLAIGSLNRD